MPGTELLGQYQDSGCIEAPYLIRRPEGRMVEVSHLLYLVAASIDGDRTIAEVGRRVAVKARRHLSPASVQYLVDQKLRPLGVVDDATPARPATTASPPLLGLTVRRAIIPQAVVRAASSALRPFFLPPVIVAALVALTAADAWLLSRPGGPGVEDILYRPGWLIAVFGLTVLGGFLHELGHATGSRYGGANPGVIGAGIYLIWPAFFNDLNESYRLSRRGRLRADLGGIYFNILFIVALAGVYGFCRWPPLIAALVVQHVMVLQQFLPFVRLDGYYIVSDLVGVPNLFSHIRPVLSSLIPGRAASASVSDLKPKARVVVTAWVLVTAPLLFAATVALVLCLPGMMATARDALLVQLRTMVAAGRAGEPLIGVVSALQLLVLVVPFVGLGGTLVRFLHRSCSRGLHPSGRGRPPVAVRRLLGVLIAVNLLTAMAIAAGVVHGPGQGGMEAVATTPAREDHPLIKVEPPSLDPPPGDGAPRSDAASPASPSTSTTPTFAPSTTVAPAVTEDDPPPLEAPRAASGSDGGSKNPPILQPSSAQVALALSEVKQRIPLFSPTESQAGEFGKQVCDAFDRAVPSEQIQANVLQAASKLPLIKVTPADAELVLRAAVRLYCPWHEPALG